MQRKINNTVISLRMGKNQMAKTPPSDFQVTTPETPLLSQQAITGKESQVPYQPSWTLTLIPNRTSFVVTVPLSDARLPSTWLTNYAYPSMQLQSPTKKIVGCKILQFIHMMKIKKMLGHKTLRCTYIATSSSERDELGQELRLQSQFVWTKFTQSLCNLCTVWQPLKNPFICLGLGEKKAQRNIHRSQENHIWILKFLNLDR